MKSEPDWEFLSEQEPVAKQKVGESQLSLFELFFMTTLAAVAIGIYIYISPLLALLAGGSLLVIASVKAFGCRNMVMGGLVGFGSSIIVAYSIIALTDTDTSSAIAIALLCPAIGYIVGGLMAELSEDGSL